MSYATASDGVMAAQMVQLLLNLGISLISWVIAIACYVLLAISLYSIAKRRNIGNPWLAWLPLGNLWILGAISDQYQCCVKGKKTARRKWLLGMAIAASVLAGIIMLISVGVMVFMMVPAIFGMSEDLIVIFGIAAMVITLLCLLPILAVALVSLVMQYMCMFDVYRSCKPDSAVLFLILSILLGDLYIIFMLVCKNSDEGMPFNNCIEEC